MTLEEIFEKIKHKMDRALGLNAKIKFDFGSDGIIFADTTVSPPVISNEDRDADTTFTCSLTTFEAILNGKQDPNPAYMMGKLKIKGSLGLAMKLNGILED